MTKGISPENAQRIAVDFMKRQKNTEKVDVAAVEQSHSDWVIRGTCPINMEGHPWVEKFEVIIDTKGNVRNSRSSLL